jgi:hypothetical protein
MELKNLIQKLNDTLPKHYKAKVGGSIVLNTMGLINRKPEDVDIVISHNINYQCFIDHAADFEAVHRAIKELFPLDEVHQIPFVVYCGQENPESNQEKYAFNLKVYNINLWSFGQNIHTLNILVQKEYVGEDYYSILKLDDIPCVPVRSILDAKKSYNRPKDAMDFIEILKVLV